MPLTTLPQIPAEKAVTLAAATRNRGQGRRAAQRCSGLRWAEQSRPRQLQLPLPSRRVRALSVGELWPLAPLLAYVTPGSPQSCSLGPDPHFVLLIVALNLFSLRSSSCHSINSAFFEGLLGSGVSDFPGGSDGKASACNAGDLGLIPGSGRSPGEGNGNPLPYSCLENPMDGDRKSTRLNSSHR